MTSEYVIDSYAWLEYFRGTESGKKIRSYVEGGIGRDVRTDPG